jgi:spore photoproduct lyase
MSRYNGERVFVNTNVEEIFQSVVEWEKEYTKVPDQQDPIYTMVDIACNTDLVLMQKHLPEPLIDYLKRYDNHPRLNTTMATKYPSLLKIDVNHFNKKPRVRVSLMPQIYSDILEPKMQSISSRIRDIDRIKALGWEVHCNYSPVIFYPGWEEHYNNLFKEVREVAGENKCEVIALTNHARQMARSSESAQELMKYSSEIKNSELIMRYPLSYKFKLIDKFKSIYTQYFQENTIRYIF